MQHDQTSGQGNAGVRTIWIVIFCVSLFFLALCWAVDRSIVYLISGFVAFSLFKILQLRKKTEDPSQEPYQGSSGHGTGYERTNDPYEQYRPSAFSIFMEDVKQVFKKESSNSRTPQQSRVLIVLVAGFIGFIFFLSIIGAFLGGADSSIDYYRLRAQEYYDVQQYDSAAYYYKFAIQSDPENADLYYARGNAFLYGQKSDSALILFDEALRINPNHENAQYMKGYIYFDRRNYDQAIIEGRQILAYSPDYISAMLLMGDCFYNQNQPDSALRWYEDAYGTGYRNAILCQLMASIYETKGKKDVAINLYKESIEQDSTIVESYTRLGELVPGEEGDWYRTRAAELKTN